MGLTQLMLDLVMHLPMSGFLLGLLLLLLAGQLALTLELGLPLTAIGLIVQID